MSYQTVIRDQGNELVTNQETGMQINILQGSADGTAVYIETQTPTTISFNCTSTFSLIALFKSITYFGASNFTKARQ